MLDLAQMDHGAGQGGQEQHGEDPAMPRPLFSWIANDRAGAGSERVICLAERA